MKRTTLLTLTLMLSCILYGQEEDKQMIRLARLVIVSTQLETYKTFLKEEIETSLKLEPGLNVVCGCQKKSTSTFHQS